MTTASATAVAERHARATGVDLYRACALCDHGPERAGDPARCDLDWAHPVPITFARSREGRCGPDAAQLRIDGWDLT